MKDFMLIYKGGDPEWMTNTSPEEMASSMEQWGAWLGMLEQKEQLVSGGSPLHYTGKSLTKDGVVTDVSMAEIKELVTGYSVIKAEDYAGAIEVAKQCPIFNFPDITVEVREVFQIG